MQLCTGSQMQYHGLDGCYRASFCTFKPIRTAHGAHARGLVAMGALGDDIRLKYAKPEWLTPSDGAPGHNRQSISPTSLTSSSDRSTSNSSASTSTPTSPSSTPRIAIPPKALGVDYGTVWTGLATAEMGRGAPLKVIRNNTNKAEFMREVVDAALDRGAGGIVVGIPLRPGQRVGDPSADTAHASKCRAFAESLSIVAGAKGLDVFLYDEARTTAVAMMQADISGTDRLGNIGRKAKNDKKVDAWSAALLLTRFYQRPGSAVRVKLRAIQRGKLVDQQQQQQQQQQPVLPAQQQQQPQPQQHVQLQKQQPPQPQQQQQQERQQQQQPQPLRLQPRPVLQQQPQRPQQ